MFLISSISSIFLNTLRTTIKGPSVLSIENVWILNERNFGSGRRKEI